MYYECLELDFEVEKTNDVETYPPFIFDIYDHDDGILDHTDDFLGRAIIEARNANILMEDDIGIKNKKKSMAEIDIEPKWHNIHFKLGDPACG